MPRVSRIGLLISSVLLVAVVVFTVTHLSEARHFASLMERAKPKWVIVALAFQLTTYVCAGGIWHAVASAAGYRLRLVELIRLSIEKLSVDQVLPSGGLSGNLVVVAAMRRLGLTASVATEALLIDILAYYLAYAVVTAMTFFVLWIRHRVMPSILALVVGFAVLLAAVPLGTWWLLSHRDWRPGPRIAKLRVVTAVFEALEGVSLERIRRPRLLAVAGTLNLAIFLLDAGTLWSLLRATGTDTHLFTAFAALLIGSLAGTISLLPGGLGSFEAGCTATLGLLGVPIEAALAGTLFLRGLTLWLPMIPGMVLARRDLAHRSPSTSGEREGEP